MGYTHHRAISVTETGYAVGVKGSEIPVVSVTGQLYQQGTAITASAAEINAISGGGLDATELGILNGATVTTAELNVLDVSVQTVITTVIGSALNVSLTVNKLALTGAGAVTLAAPSAADTGRVKVIEMTTDNGDVTLSLANVAGGSAATTCTWSAVGQALVLVAGVAKWAVVSESGVALT